MIPTAQSEFTVAPLLKVPPASRGEPRARPVSPARRENLQEGVTVYAFRPQVPRMRWATSSAEISVIGIPLPGCVLAPTK